MKNKIEEIEINTPQDKAVTSVELASKDIEMANEVKPDNSVQLPVEFNDKNTVTKKTKTHQSINKWRIYTGNARGVLKNTNEFAGCISGANGECYLGPFVLCGAPIGLLSYPALIFTLTLGAGIQTAIDIRKREPLLLSDIEQMRETLASLDRMGNNTRVDEVATAIIEHRHGYYISKLQIKLRESEDLRYEYEEQFKQEAITHIIDSQRKAANNLLQSHQVTYFKAEPTHVQLSKNDGKKIQDYISEKMVPINDQIRAQKVKLISNYLAAQHNAGKELQHYILGILQPIADEIKESASNYNNMNVI